MLSSYAFNYDQLRNVLEFLDVTDILSLRSVCVAAFHAFVDGDDVWAVLLKRNLRGYDPISQQQIIAPYQKLKKFYLYKSVCRWENFWSASVGINRCLHRSAYDPVTQKTYIFGGERARQSISSGSVFQDVLMVDISEEDRKVIISPVKIAQSSTFPPTTYSGAAVVLQGHFYVFGGFNEGEPTTGDTWRLPIAATGTPDLEHSWHCVVDGSLRTRNQSTPSQRYGHSMVTLKDELIILFGGSTDSESFNDTWLYCPVRGWMEVPMVRSPSARAYFTMVVSGDHVYVVGGTSHLSRFTDVWRVPISAIIGAYSLHAARTTTRMEGNDDFETPLSSLSTSFDVLEESTPRLGTGNPNPVAPPLSWELVANDENHGCVSSGNIAIGPLIIIFGAMNAALDRYHPGVRIFDTRTMMWEVLRFTCLPPAQEEQDSLATRFTNETSNPPYPYQRVGQVALPTTSGVLYMGGISSNGSSIRSILHLVMLGTMKRAKTAPVDGTNESQISQALRQDAERDIAGPYQVTFEN